MQKLTLATGITSALLLSACQTSPAPSQPTPDHSHNDGHNTVQPTHKTLSDVTCNKGTQTVNIAKGSVAQNGTVQGYNYCEYNVHLKAGQRLDVSFNSPSPQANVIVYDSTTIDLNEPYVASSNEVLPVRVLLTRNEARSGKAYPFSVKFNVE